MTKYEKAIQSDKEKDREFEIGYATELCDEVCPNCDSVTTVYISGSTKCNFCCATVKPCSMCSLRGIGCNDGVDCFVLDRSIL